MHRRHPPIPRHWLMTDERMGEALWEALERIPRGSGVVFRHYSLGRAERLALFRKVAKVARRRGLMLLRAGPGPLPGEEGVHGGRGAGLVSRAAHNRSEAVAAMRAGADLVFLSPVFATTSHPGARALGRVRAGMLARGIKPAVIGLGGMNARRAKKMKALGFHGWAGIDAWMRD